MLLDPSFCNNKILKLLTLQNRVELARIFLEDPRVIAAGVHNCLEITVTAEQMPKWGLDHLIQAEQKARKDPLGGYINTRNNAGGSAKAEYLFRPSAEMTTLFSQYLDGYRSELTEMEIASPTSFNSDVDFN
jgi:hypothetical protein